MFLLLSVELAPAIVGGPEWGCTDPSGRVSAFYQELDATTVVNTSTVLLHTHRRQLYDCFKRAHVSYK